MQEEHSSINSPGGWATMSSATFLNASASYTPARFMAEMNLMPSTKFPPPGYTFDRNLNSARSWGYACAYAEAMYEAADVVKDDSGSDVSRDEKCRKTWCGVCVCEWPVSSVVWCDVSGRLAVWCGVC